VRFDGRDDDEESREGKLVYAPPKSDGEQTERNWIIEVPLLFNVSRAVGTIGFADAGTVQSRSSELERIVLRLEAGMLDDRPTLDRFTEFASSSFWRIAAEIDNYAEQIYDEYWKERAGG
jgi:HAMP domain-containing protein